MPATVTGIQPGDEYSFVLLVRHGTFEVYAGGHSDIHSSARFSCSITHPSCTQKHKITCLPAEGHSRSTQVHTCPSFTCCFSLPRNRFLATSHSTTLRRCTMLFLTRAGTYSFTYTHPPTHPSTHPPTHAPALPHPQTPPPPPTHAQVEWALLTACSSRRTRLVLIQSQAPVWGSLWTTALLQSSLDFALGA
jgi:hypothetical protein